MFCSNCGNQIAEGLKYCNRCGARLVSELEKADIADLAQTSVLAQNLSKSIGIIGAVGIIALAFLIGNLIRRDEIHPSLVVLVLIFSAVLFGIISLLVRQMSRVSAISRQTPVSNFKMRESLPKADTGRLISYNEPAQSVTENTTRNFDSIFVKRAEK